MVALTRFRATPALPLRTLFLMPGSSPTALFFSRMARLMAGWYFAGPDSESSTDVERNDISRQINVILSRLGSGWMIQVEAVAGSGNRLS